MPPNPEWNCNIANTIVFTSGMCSTYFILGMTFERFYSIVRPHKAASFNTVKRAKITIVCIVIFSILFHIPHLFLTTHEGHQCIAYGRSADKIQASLYYWLSFILNFVFPFSSLLVMNGVIIYTIQRRSKLKVIRTVSQGQGHGEGQHSKGKSTERQIYVTLLSITFGFLLLTTPTFSVMLYTIIADFTKSPKKFAGFYLAYHIAHKTYYTNYGVNFFLYVMSGGKFRKDLIMLFLCRKEQSNEIQNSNNSASVTRISSVWQLKALEIQGLFFCFMSF